MQAPPIATIPAASKSGSSAGIKQLPLGYQPALDGLRALAVMAVIASHSALWGRPGGFIGVDVFFALSGFLITSLLLDEWATCGGIGLLAFYVRRFLRLIPPLLAFVAIAGAFFFFLGSRAERHEVVIAVPWVLVYLANWGQVHNPDFGPFRHLWSLAVEEQFYILWAPISALALRTRYRERALLWAAVGGVIAGSIARLYPIAFGGAPRGGFGTDLNCDGIFLGCGLAVVFRQGQLRLSPRVLRWLGVTGVLVLGELVRHAVVMHGIYAGEALLLSVAVATAGVIASVVTQPDAVLSRLLASPPLVWLGRRSYAMYLWHFALTSLLAPRGAPAALTFAVGLGGSIVLAQLSMAVIEGPLQRVRARFSYQASCTVLS